MSDESSTKSEAETTRIAKAVEERGGYQAGKLDISNFPPPPSSISVEKPTVSTQTDSAPPAVDSGTNTQ